MADLAVQNRYGEAPYHGLRMTADEYFQLEEDGARYELMDGVVCMSPSPTPDHQAVIVEIVTQIALHLRAVPVGRVFAELDTYLGHGPSGADLVYRPDVVFYRLEQLGVIRERAVVPPDLVVEVVSSSSGRMDRETKKGDYERAGVREYWLIDPDRSATRFYRLQEGRYVEVPAAGDTFASQVIEGFVLDLARVRDAALLI